MRVGIPHFGYDTLALKGFLEELGAEVVMPPPTSRRTLEIGVKLAPELVCMPFKITLGNFVEALENGADTLLMAAGARKCRFGYYHYLQEMALRQVKADFRLVPISQYSAYQFIFRLIPGLFGVKPVAVMQAVYHLLAKSALTRDFRRLLNRKRAVDFDFAERVMPEALNLIEQARTIPAMKRVGEEIKRRLRLNGSMPAVRVGLVGEIFYTVDQQANQEIEKQLGRLGAEVVFERCLYNHLRHLLHIDSGYRRSRRLAKPYLAECPGGEAIRTVGEARWFVQQGVDGIIHVFPFTCMPENIALEALQRICENAGVPLLSLSFDEHTSNTGLVTRLEAFVELLRRRNGRRVPGN
ncbi:MAG: acyl-CoA dehydratase activase-related protein [candidate division WOR-3 bacterium]|jgi:predicted nucleotide-binding protein (sugar kinase/HSP70/actin superfamily)